ncbi:MAG: putative nuclease of putative toxin-antitoxin system [Bacteroidia bacterium]|jgi:predicted nuclease of predicted toxin-antitoxin system
MAQTKIIVDTNSYFRLAQNIHPLLCQPFGKEDYTLYMHADLNAELRNSPRLQTKFDWAAESGFRKNRQRSLSLSKVQKKEIEETFDFMWEFVKEEYHGKLGKGPSYTDTLIVATASVLEIRVVTDDQDMIALAETYGVHQITSLELMQLMLLEKHLDLDKIEQVVAQWEYDGDAPYRDWKAEYERLFDRAPPKG